jgi:prepilin-type processing-associated H-X9-DG protein
MAMMQYSTDYDEGLPAWSEYYGQAQYGSETNSGGYTGDSSVLGYWQAKLQPYVKTGNMTTVSLYENSGVWHCPDAGDKGEQLYISGTNRYSYSYGYNAMLAYTNYGKLDSWGSNFTTDLGNGYYRYPKLPQMSNPSSLVYAGDGGGYNGRIAPAEEYNCYYKRAINDGAQCWEVPDRHNGGANYVFCDGHAKWLQASIIYPMVSKPSNNSHSGQSASDQKSLAKATGTYFCYGYQECQDWLALAQ